MNVLYEAVNGLFEVGQVYAMTLTIGTEHIPITVKLLPTNEQLGDTTLYHWQRVKASDPSFIGHTWPWSKEAALSQMCVLNPELAQGDTI
tara:strand:+ start:274 stop:543 length:270 start_codon:yes stop_codon:yes gene_type:complete